MSRKPIQSVKKDLDSIEVLVEVVVFKENGHWIAYCPAFDLSTYGQSEADARHAFDDAMNIFIEETHNKGTLEKFLLQNGWQLQQRPAFYKPPTLNMSDLGEYFPKMSKTGTKFLNERVSMPF
jgi:hypothetical protein